MPQITGHSNACGGTRNHDQLHVERQSWEIESFDLRGIDTFETLKCLGCGEVKMRHSKWVTDEQPKVAYFPPAVFRPEPRWFSDLWQHIPPGEVQVLRLLKEVYVALHNDLLALAAMGIRAVIERMMVLKVGDHGQFGKNLHQFELAGFVSRLQRERLQAVLELGHAAIHRGVSPNRDDMIAVLDVVENLVEVLYLHDEKIEALQQRTPKRVRDGKR